ncbi:hypothetical protein BAJUN_02930 [Bajunvirus bajun]|uniref:Uncharacterized protein n=1 Tax=Brevundimonas phage vB_BgoS-Bajun TaxID=2948594 RepID=A0A9E7SS44_9CAUD|nr:hypothetical protein BAJUN_02930 [Brevundimonas phage vB_BgoS-Bajun]
MLVHIAEAVGSVMVITSLWLLGRDGEQQRLGLWLNLGSIIPWTIFALMTHSWFLLAQGFIIGGFHIHNLRRRRRAGLAKATTTP